jgi:hypothetical protein
MDSLTFVHWDTEKKSNHIEGSERVLVAGIWERWVQALMPLGFLSKLSYDWQSTASLSWCEATIRVRDEFFFILEIFHRKLRVFFVAPSLTRGRVCCLLLLLGLARAVPLVSESRRTQNHILLSSRIYIPQEQSDPVIPSGTGFPFSSPFTAHRARVVFYPAGTFHSNLQCTRLIQTGGEMWCHVEEEREITFFCVIPFYFQSVPEHSTKRITWNKHYGLLGFDYRSDL